MVVTLASLALVVVALRSSVIGVVIDLALLAVAGWASLDRTRRPTSSTERCAPFFRAHLRDFAPSTEMLLTATAAGLQASYLNQPVQVEELRPRVAELLGGPGVPQLVLRHGYPRRNCPPRRADRSRRSSKTPRHDDRVPFEYRAAQTGSSAGRAAGLTSRQTESRSRLFATDPARMDGFGAIRDSHAGERSLAELAPGGVYLSGDAADELRAREEEDVVQVLAGRRSLTRSLRVSVPGGRDRSSDPRPVCDTLSERR